MGEKEKLIISNGSNEKSKTSIVTQSELLENMQLDFKELPEGLVIGKFQFKKEEYKDASINEDIITKLN